MQTLRSTVRPDSSYQALLDQQPYTVELEGLVLEVHRNVFPPDFGRCARNLARLACEYPARSALDMGCGTGFIALSLKRAGVVDVWASDIHGPAIECTARNQQLNPHVGSVRLIRSDLFERFPRTVRFDLIVFNQPFGPGRDERRCGCGPDGGAAISRRFLATAPEFLNSGGVVLMAFSDRQAPEHDPKLAAEGLGYAVSTLLDLEYNDSRNFIYAMRLKVQLP